MEQIQRDGVWWTRDPAGGWLRFDAAKGGWQPSATPPPPPPPPPPVVPAPEPVASSTFPYDARFYVPLEKKKRPRPRFGHNLDPRVAMAAAGLLALLMLGGAGWMVFGDDGAAPVSALGSADDGSDHLSKKQRFIRAADGVCAHLMTVAGKMPVATDLSELAAVLRDVRGEIWKSYKKLQGLNPPAKVRKEWKRYLGNPEQLQVFDDMIAATERGDVATLQSLATQLENQGHDKTDRWAKRYGFKVCSQDF
ncbi:MAG: hypothetical protein ACRDI3_03230 [Actinomycetota bacterium]